MKSIKKFLQIYANLKIRNNIINFVIKFFIFFIIYISILILIEKNAFLDPNIKIKIFDLTYAIIIFNLIYILLKVVIHKNNLFDNSNKQQLAKELINKFPIKDRLINALQIYSKIDLKNPYSDLTTKAINDVEKELNFLDFKKIELKISYNIIYALLALQILLSSSIIFSNNNYQATVRLISKNTKYEKPLPFQFQINKKNIKIFKGGKYTIDIEGIGELPDKINLFWLENNNLYNREINKINQIWTHTFESINSEIKIWAEYKNAPILPYNKYNINSDTVNIKLKIRPKIKDLDIKIIHPAYTKITDIKHKNTSIKINAIKGSKIQLKGKANKLIKSSNIIFGKDSIASMKIQNNIISHEFEVFDSKDISIICYDKDNNSSLRIKYFINMINDMNPTITIDKPKNNIKLDEKYLIQLSGQLSDDFGLNKALLEYYIIKPYYLEQDTIINNKQIFKSQKNNTNEYFEYDWDVSNLDIGPGDEIIYWIKAYDNNNVTGPGIGLSNTQRAYFPSLEELFLEVENEQKDIFETFDNMNESMEELKNIYEDMSNDVLKNEIGWDQEEDAGEMINEIQSISNKIENLEQAIQKIEELNENNNLVNENLGEKIEALQKMFQDIITPELMAALQELQKSLNDDDFQKSLEELNKLEFKMEDLENELDRMIDLFKQIVAEQKLDELIKKIENMENLQKEISNKINNKELNHDTKSIEEEQRNNLNDILKTMKSTEELFKDNNNKTAEDLNQLRNSSISNELKKELNKISNNNETDKNKSSTKIENHINEMKNKLNEIISEYNKKLGIEILTMYTRIIKNLLDMSYEKELINKDSKSIKYKTNPNIRSITNKENIILYQYKNLFIQISDLSSKRFHIKPEVSKSFGQIFNNLIKTINNFEQGKINVAKEHQKLTLEYINKAAILLLKAMDEMQASKSASGYEEYLQSLQEISQGQQLMNQGMQSLLPIPFGQQPGQNSLMESLISQQKKLMEQLKKLMEEGGNPGGGKEGQGELGKALEDMEEIINNLQNNIINEETFDKGEKVYNKLLNHQKATKEKGMDKLWETETFNENELLKNNKTIDLKNESNPEIQELYETLNRLNKNKNITKENKNIIEEYIKILINKQINKKNNEE